jgi:replicative DNA helicase
MSGTPVALHSFEMSTRDCTVRTMAGYSGVRLDKYNNLQFADKDWKAHIQACGYIDSKHPNFKIDQTARLDLSQLIRRIKQLHHKERTGLAIIDYLQLIKYDPQQKKIDQMEEMANGLKDLARELKIPIILVSQLNRKVNDRVIKRPQIGDLKGSGAIEQAADVVVLIHHPYKFSQKEEYGKAELDIAKNRNGPSQVVYARWIEEICRFKDYI